MNVRFQRHMMNRICWFRFCWIPPYLCVYVLLEPSCSPNDVSTDWVHTFNYGKSVNHNKTVLKS